MLSKKKFADFEYIPNHHQIARERFLQLYEYLEEHFSTSYLQEMMNKQKEDSNII